MPFSVALGLGLSTLAAGPARAVDVLATAVTGEPYGVASIEIPLPEPVVGNPLPPLSVTDAEGRVLYPMARDERVAVRTPPSERPVPRVGRGRLLGRVGDLIRELSSRDEELKQTVARQVTFLFRGSEPLRIRLADARGEIGTYEIRPEADAAVRDELLRQWWDTYTAAAERQLEAADYPPWVETYLVAMLSGRLNLPLPDWYRSADKLPDDGLTDSLKLVAGAAETGNDMFAVAASGEGVGGRRADSPLPEPPAWQTPPVPGRLDETQTEPIASRVPPECFMIRYGSFENYLWFRDLSAEYGGDISRMVTLRGFVDNGTARFEDQLNLETSELSRMLGPTVIEDQAIIGRDLFLSDGATMGVLFKAANAFLLRTSLNNERASRARADEAVELTDIEIAGRTVTLLRSSDNRVRSFMAEDDSYIFVTNSRTLVERFFEVGESGASLAATPTFRLSRQYMPLERGDTIFAYFSPEMLQGLASPRYLVELRRRFRAEADIALVHLARLAAASEGNPLRGVGELTAAGYLPSHFGPRGDASGVITVGDRVLDSKRGARGTFLPIADVEVEAVTPRESEWYRRIAADYSERFASLDPIMVGVRRTDLSGDGSDSGDAGDTGIERLDVHAEISPFRAENYGWWAEQLGEPTRAAIEFAPDDIVAVQARVASAQLGPPTHLFAAVKDSSPPDPEEFDGILGSYLALRQIPGYLGAWPQPGALDRLPLGLGRGQPVGPNMSRLIGGVYRFTGGGFSIISFWPDLLQETLPHLAAVEVDDSAQVRVHVGNLVGSRLQGWVNAQLYRRAAEASVTGANFLNLLSRQLDVAPPEAAAVAENVLAMRLQCSLGGEYVFDESIGRWVSTAWGGERPAEAVPPDYVAPMLTWFRGADATVTQYADRVVSDSVVDIARQPAANE